MRYRAKLQRILFASYFAGVRRFFPVGGAADARYFPARVGGGQEDGIVLELHAAVMSELAMSRWNASAASPASVPSGAHPESAAPESASTARSPNRRPLPA